MDFLQVLSDLVDRFDRGGLRYALIGGFAMGLRGVQRATVDLDFLLMLEDLDGADSILESMGFRCVFRSENVSHYRAQGSDFGRIDILHAFRGPSRGMLERAERVEIEAGLSVPVAGIEDIIGLKIQAAVNDPARKTQDWLDIQMLLEAAAHNRVPLDWELLAEYLDVFGLSEEMPILERWYGKAE